MQVVPDIFDSGWETADQVAYSVLCEILETGFEASEGNT